LPGSPRFALSQGIKRRLRLAHEVFEECAGDRVPMRPENFSKAAPSPSPTTALSSGISLPSTRVNREEASELIAQYLAADLPARLVVCLGLLEFEARKDVIGIFSALLRLAAAAGMAESPSTSEVCSIRVLEYVRGHPQIFRLLLEGYGNSEIALHCGLMLRICARHQELVQDFLASGQMLRLVQLASDPRFDISSDAFSSLRDLLLAHKVVSAPYLVANFQDFFILYNGLLQSQNYVTQRQALKLLSEVLLDRSFMKVMLLYIGDDQFLQIHMNLLRNNSKAIQFQAFHVFKIFVANPQKPIRVQSILFKNKERLLMLLENFKASRQEDQPLIEDYKAVIEKLHALGPPLKVRPPSPLEQQGQQIHAQQPAGIQAVIA